MMTSWSIDSGDTFNTVETAPGTGNGSNMKQQLAPVSAAPVAAAAATKQEQVSGTPAKDQNANTTDVRRRNDKRTPPPSPLPGLPQCYQIEKSTEINSEDRAFFGISAPRGRSDRSHRTVRFRFGVVKNNCSESSSRDTKTGSRPPSRSVGEDEEHELVLSWSVRTGKRIISYDRIILYSITLKGFGVCDHTVLTPDGKFSFRMLSCTEPPLGAAPNFETSELLINGVSYFDLPRMEQTGALEMGPSLRDHGGSIGNKRGRKVIYTVGEALCPDAIERSRQEAGFEDEEA